MAEIIVGVAATASFVQLIDFGAKLIRRLNQYGSKGGELPKSFQIIQDQLPLLVKAVAEMKTRIDQDSSPESLKKAISPVLTGCQRKLEELDKILAKMPPTSDSWRERGKKALFSLSQETDIKRLITALRDYTMTLVFYNTTAASKVQNTQGTVRFHMEYPG
jgi:hypothetical protein